MEQLRTAEESSQAYHRMHKKLVGPGSTKRLLRHYDELTQSQYYEHMHEAGWAMAEAALVGTTYSTREKIDMLDAASEAWQTARDIHQQQALAKDAPCQERLLRIDTSLPAITAFRAIVSHRFDTPTRVRYHEEILSTARRTGNMLEYARFNKSGHESNYKGLLGEQLGILALSREYSGKIFPTTSLARSGNGKNYPSETHDLQVLSFRRGKRNQFTPIEVKISKTPSRYTAPVLSLRRSMNTRTPDGLLELLDTYERDYYDPQSLTKLECERLDSIKLNVIELIRSYHQKQRQAMPKKLAT